MSEIPAPYGARRGSGRKPESRKSEIRYVTDDPKRMLGKFVARRALKTWTEQHVDKDTNEVLEIERSEVLLERGTYIDQEQLATISFLLQEGSLKEVEVSNQNRLGVLVQNRCLYPYKAVVKINDKKKSFLLYATSVANALLILVDYVELNFKGSFSVTDIKEMDYCTILIDNLKSADARRYEIDKAYINGQIGMEEFVEATCDNIAKGNPDSDEVAEEKEPDKKFYQINAHVVFYDDKEGSNESDLTFIVQTISAVRANMLIEHYLREEQEKRWQESLSHPERTFVKYQINSFIEESKIIPIGCFIPKSFSDFYNGDDDG